MEAVRIAPRTGIRKKSQAARQKLLSAALKVIGSKGYASATMEGISREAGVSKGLAYYHFANKAELAAAVLDQGLGTMVSTLNGAAAGRDNAIDAMDAMVEVLAEKIYSNVLVSRFVFEEMFRDGRDCSAVVHGYIQEFLAMIEALVVRGQGEGVFSSALDSRFTAVSLFGMVMTTSMYYTGVGNEDSSVEQAEFVAMLKQQAMAQLRA